jgi:hypothetical protein
MRGLSTPVQIAMIVAVVVLVIAALWFGVRMDWFPVWLAS